MGENLYKHENNIFQSLNWLAFQQGYGRKVIAFDNFSGLLLDLPFGKKALWVQKAPYEMSDFDRNELKKKIPKEVVFIRIEPNKITDTEVNKFKLKPVTKKSIFSGQASPKATRFLDISKSEEEILAQMKPKTRYNIRLAEKKGVKVIPLDSDDVLYKVLLATSNKGGGYHPHEKNYYTKLIKELGRNDVAHIFVAEHEDDFPAAILVSFFGGTATYLYGGQDNVKKNLMSPYLCQWEAIKYAKNHGCKYYDFWGVAETDDPNDPWAGITRFKEGFGGEKVVFPGSFDYIVRPFWYVLFSMLAKINHLVRR